MFVSASIRRVIMLMQAKRKQQELKHIRIIIPTRKEILWYCQRMTTPRVHTYIYIYICKYIYIYMRVLFETLLDLVDE